MTGIAEQWLFGAITDYYDYERARLVELPHLLSELDVDDRGIALAAVRDRVAAMAAQFTDDILQTAAVSIASDLYLTVGGLEVWNGACASYYSASIGTFFTQLQERGYVLQFVIENTFPEHLARPIKLFPGLFAAAGLTYVCPHEIAARLDQNPEHHTLEGLRPHIAEARDIAAQIASRCEAEGRQFVYLEVDFDKGCLDAVLALSDSPGAVGVFRNGAPESGADMTVMFPTSRR